MFVPPALTGRAATECSEACQLWNSIGSDLQLGMIAADGHTSMDTALGTSGPPGFGEAFRIRLLGAVETGPSGFHLVFSAQPQVGTELLEIAPLNQVTAQYTATGTESGLYFGLMDLPDGTGTTIEGGREYLCVPFSVPANTVSVSHAVQQGSLGAFRTRVEAVSSRLAQPEPRFAHQIAADASPPDRVGVFAGGGFTGQGQDRSGSVAGYDLETVAGTAGVEYLVTEGFLAGIAFTLGDDTLAVDDGLGDVDFDGFAVHAYAIVWHRGFHAAAQFAMGELDLEITRPTASGTPARASTHSGQQAFTFDLGYDLRPGAFVTGPLLSLDYLAGDVDGYTESGAGSSNLQVARQDLRSLVSGVGWQVSRPFRVGRGAPWVPRIGVGWNHENLDDAGQVTFTFEGAPELEFGLDAAVPGRDYATLEASLTGWFGRQDRGRVGVAYQTQLFRDGFTSRAVWLSAGWTF